MPRDIDVEALVLDPQPEVERLESPFLSQNGLERFGASAVCASEHRGFADVPELFIRNPA
jgi:hypothetical protein